MLERLAGVEDKFYIASGGARLFARNETRAVLPGRTTAVHYVKFPLGAELAVSVRAGKSPLMVGVEHAAYRAEAVLPPRTMDELALDLA